MLNYTATLCEGEVDKCDGYTALVEINLPSNLDWIPTSGVVTLRTFNPANMTGPLCENIDSSSGARVRQCSFVFQKDIGDKILFEVQANEQMAFSLHLESNFSTTVLFLERKCTVDML